MGDNPGRIRLWAVGVWLAAWQALGMSMAALWPHGGLLLPTPSAVLACLGRLALTPAFWRTVGWSSLRILGGFLLSCLAAVLCAALSARFQRFRELMAPAVAAVKAVPVVSFIILALVWLDERHLSLLIAGLMVFPPVYLNTLAGIAGADRKLLEMAEVFRIPFRRRLWGIWLPAVLPHFRSACSLSLGLCWKAGLAAEVIGLPAGSLGERLYQAKIYFEMPELFAWTMTVVAAAALFERMFFLLVDALAGKAGCA